MSKTRRKFLCSATLAPMLAEAASALMAQAPVRSAPEGLDAEVQVPKMKFGGVEISRLVLGVNPFYGFSHFNRTLNTVMKEWYTTEKVCEVMHRANRFGINAMNYVPAGRAPQDLARFQAEGGKMHLIAQVPAGADAAALAKTLKPLAMHRQGEAVDRAFQSGQMNSVREWCKQVRDLGVLVGVGTHRPEVIELVEEQGWDVDFYAGCVYKRTRTLDEWKQVLNGQLLEMSGETYLQSDPPRMYKVMRQTRKPCFAFKVLAAGRVNERDVARAFRTAFESIKPADGVYVGVFPRIKDEVQENAEIVHGILTGSRPGGPA